MDKVSVYSELHDPKGDRIAIRPSAPCQYCEECGSTWGHKTDCILITKDELIRMVRQARRNEDNARRLAKRYLDGMRTLTAKTTSLKHELAILRRRLKGDRTDG